MFLVILRLSKHGVKKLSDLFRYFTDQFETQQMCDKAILKNGGTLKSVADCYKNQEMYNKAVHNYSHAVTFVSECCNTQNMCDKPVKALIKLWCLIKLILLQDNVFLIDVRLKKYVIDNSWSI